MKTVSTVLTAFLLWTSAGAGFAADEAEPSRAADLLPPVRMTAGGGWPIVARGRCAAVTMGDFDDDGKMDLLLGQMSEGRLRIYPNVGTAARPEFGEATDFVAGDGCACIPSGCYTAFNPQLVDFDGDGRTDILSPSFTSGIYLFRRTEDGKFAEAEMLEDRHGRPFEFRYNGAALAYDWDADGDLDLVIRGGPAGAGTGVNLVINEGGRRKPAYGEAHPLTADGKPLLGKPCSVVDWDGDGKQDLLTCAGSVYWYRNTGEKGMPVLQPAEILVPSGRYETLQRRRDEPQRMPDGPGRIDSISAVDVNSDGRLDLLAASTWCETVELPDLTDKQQAAREDVNARANALGKECRELRKTPENESREARTERQKEFLRVWKEGAALRAALWEFRNRHDYGCVWLFQRAAADN